MSGLGDYEDEMFRRSHLDDKTIDRLIAGHHVDGREMLVSFVEDTQLAAVSSSSETSRSVRVLVGFIRLPDTAVVTRS